MTDYDFRPSKELLSGRAVQQLGGDYLEYDELLASGSELGLEEDSSGHLVLIESDESE